MSVDTTGHHSRNHPKDVAQALLQFLVRTSMQNVTLNNLFVIKHNRELLIFEQFKVD